jgi:hypothetical protein
MMHELGTFEESFLGPELIDEYLENDESFRDDIKQTITTGDEGAIEDV